MGSTRCDFPITVPKRRYGSDFAPLKLQCDLGNEIRGDTHLLNRDVAVMFPENWRFRGFDVGRFSRFAD